MKCNDCPYLTPDKSAINPCPVGKYGCLREVEELYAQTTIFDDLKDAISTLEDAICDIDRHYERLDKERKQEEED